MSNDTTWFDDSSSRPEAEFPDRAKEWRTYRVDSAELSESLRRFLQSSVPTFPSAELLVFLASHAERRWQPDEIVEAIKPVVISVSAVKEYLAVFKAQRLVAEEADDGFRFAPATPELQAGTEELAHAFNERPVTLIRTIYTLSENKIRSFAESFKFKNE